MPKSHTVKATNSSQAVIDGDTNPFTASQQPLPRLLIFDLDYTLWPFWSDTHPSPPLRPHPGPGPSRTAKDRSGASFAFYPDVPAILRAARHCGISTAIASRTSAIDVAKGLLHNLGVEAPPGRAQETEDNDERAAALRAAKPLRPAQEFFDNVQIFPGNKATHLRRIQKTLGVPFEEMVFFDDEERNRNVERELGVCFWLVRDGLTWGEVERGIEKWRSRRNDKG